MIQPTQIIRPLIKPRWKLPIGVMESLVAYNCRKCGMPRPVLAMPMWEGSGNTAHDLSGNGNHGTFAGSVDWIGDQHSSALNFIPSEYVNAGNIKTTSGTISMLIYPKSISGDIRLFSQLYGLTSQGGAVGIDANNLGDGGIFVYDGAAWYRLVDNNTVKINTQTHLSITYAGSGGNVKAYLDGAYQSYTASSDFDFNGVSIGIGARFLNYHGTAFYGIMKQVLIHNTILTQRQIKFLHENPYFMYNIPDELYEYKSIRLGSTLMQMLI